MQPYCPECNSSVVSEDMLICKSCNAVRPPFGWPTDQLLGGLVDGGRYQVERRIGAGGFGAVYEVTHTLVQQKRAMKVMDQQLIGTPEVQRRFIDEWDILDKIKHPNIVRCFEIGVLPESRQPFMLLELLKGHNLFDEVWPRGNTIPNRIDPVRASRLGWQIASALHTSHTKGLLHRDLKPDNVLLVTDEHGQEQAKVIDFGIAKILGAGTVDRKTSRIVGTPEYMAPEQFSPGKELDGRLDLWQLGAVLFFIITGWPPYTADDDDPFAVYRAMREREGQGPQPSEQYPPMARYPGLDAFIGSLLSTDPDDRPESSVVALDHISALFESGELDDGAPPPAYNTGFGLNSVSMAPLMRDSAQLTSNSQVPAHGEAPRPLQTEPEPFNPAASPVASVSRIQNRRTTGGKPTSPRVTAPSRTTGPNAVQNPEEPRRRARAAPTTKVEDQNNNSKKTIMIAAGVGLLVMLATVAAMLTPWDKILGGGDAYTEPQFVRINTGRFSMGSTPEETGHADNETSHSVTITAPFMVQTTEVTQAQWERLMGNNPSGFKNCGGDCPVENVSWWDALEYLNRLSSAQGLPQCYEMSGCVGTPGVNFRCGKLEFVGLECSGYRLPTEAEWEYAARAGTGSAFYNGDLDPAEAECNPSPSHLKKIAWFCGNAESNPHPVAQLEPNFWGLYDPLGNVSEWVWDWNFGAYSGEDAKDPLGPEKGAGRTYRGGSWMSLARDCRAANRGYDEPEMRKDSLGFRPARTVP